MDCLAFGRHEKTFNEEVRSFCLTLHYYSPRAYNYLRSKFENNLPSISAIRNWYASVHASPGFENDSFGILAEKAKKMKEENKRLYGVLVIDGMAIRQHAQWNESKKKFDGFVDMGDKVTGDGVLHLAKEALVFLISGVEETFKIPLAYFLTNSLDTVQQSYLLTELLIRLHEIDVTVMAITFDGLKTNLSMCKLLGASFDGEAFIYDPLHSNRKIYIILDPPHLLKLARNTIGTRNLIDGKERKVEWRYFQLLYETQKNMSCNLGNKLNRSHMLWERRKMNVRLAGETLSKSVASSMLFLKQENDQFQDVDGTAEYAHIINDIFDVMNSTKSDGATGFKRPITRETYADHFERFDEAINYIKTLRVEGENGPILSSTVNTAYLGFYNNMINFKKMFEEYVLTDEIDKLITHRFSQDNLETLFGCIRSMNGFNDNPTAQQFEAAFRKLMVHNDVVCSNKSNCIDMGTKIL